MSLHNSQPTAPVRVLRSNSWWLDYAPEEVSIRDAYGGTLVLRLVRTADDNGDDGEDR